MSEIRTDPFGNKMVMHGTHAENNALAAKLEARVKFSLAYAKSKGWPEDPTKLSIQQIIEIRQQPGWEAAT